LNRRSCSATPASRRHPATRQRLEEREIPRVTSPGGAVFFAAKKHGAH
jgi:hypothetical protein